MSDPVMQATIEDIICPVIARVYGDNAMSRACIIDLAERINAYYGNDREDMIRLRLWDWFSGGDTAAYTAKYVEKALNGETGF